MSLFKRFVFVLVCLFVGFVLFAETITVTYTYEVTFEVPVYDWVPDSSPNEPSGDNVRNVRFEALDATGVWFFERWTIVGTETMTRTETGSVTVTVPDGASPDDVADTLEAIARSSGLEILEDADGEIAENNGEAAEAESNGLATDTDTNSVIDDSQHELNEEFLSTTNGAGQGDPVRLSTGEFYTSVTDLEHSVGSEVLSLTRHYEKGVSTGNTFGPLWRSWLDTRIVRGTVPDIVSALANIRREEQIAETSYLDSQAAYDAGIAFADSMTGPSGELTTLLSDINSAIANLNSAKSGRRQEARDAIDSRINQFEAQRGNVQAKIAEINAQKSEVLASLPQVEQAFDSWKELEQLVSEYETILPLHSSNAALNELAAQYDSELDQFRIGLDRVVMISGSGLPVQFELQEDPNLDTPATFPNGLANYYTAGSQTSATEPTQGSLLLLADGSFEYTALNQDVTYFNYLGLPTRMEYHSGTWIDLSYNDQHQLTKITDTYGREVTLSWTGNNVTTLEDPAGRTVHYSYTNDLLTGYTDANGETYTYGYAGDRFTSITKPDGTRRLYNWEYLDDSWKIVSTADELGNLEHFTYSANQDFTEYTNPSGIWQRHHYNERSLETQIDYAYGYQEFFTYDANDQRTLYTRRNGAAIATTYDEDGNLLSRTDELGYTEEWTYNSQNDVTTYTDKAGRTTSFTYDANGNLTGVTFPDASRQSFAYDDFGQMTSSTNEEGESVAYTYDGNGNLSTVTDAAGHIWTYSHDAIGNLLVETDPDGNATSYTYNGDNEIVRVTHPDGSTELFEYNNRKLLSSYTDRNGNQYVYEYNAKRDLIRSVDPLGQVTEFTPREDGKIVERVIDGVHTTRYDYDEIGRLVYEIQVESGEIVSYAYDSVDNLIAVTDPEGNQTLLSYNARDELIRVQDPLVTFETFDYSPTGNLIGYTDADGYLTTYAYDLRDRLTSETDPSGAITAYEYDLAGRTTAMIDANGNRTSYAYDPRGLLISVADAAGGVQTFEYDPRRNRVSATDTNGHTIAYGFDENNRITSVTDAAGFSESYTYDANGNITAVTDRNGNSSTAGFDALDRRVSATDPEGYTQSWSYNVFGNVTSYTDQEGFLWQNQYDPQQRLTATTDPLGNSRTYLYDKRGFLTSWYDEEGRGEYFIYDERGQLRERANDLDQIYSYHYDDRGNMTAEIDPVGVAHHYRYDERGVLTGETDRLGSVQSYEYDGVGNLTRQTDFNGLVKLFEYDSLNRRTAEYHDGALFASWSYDGEGNLVAAVNDTTAQTYSYDPRNQLIESYDSLSERTTVYEYDRNGNKTREQIVEGAMTSSFTYDGRNLLASVTDFTGEQTVYEYDGVGREVRRTLGTGVTDTYRYDGRGNRISHQITGTNPWSAPLSETAHVYNRAGQRIYDIDGDAAITAYRYDEAARLSEVSYPAGSGKETLDFRARLEAGLYPESGQGNQVRLPNTPGVQTHEVENDIRQLLNEFRDRMPQGQYSVTPDTFYEQLVVDPNLQGALYDAVDLLDTTAYLNFNQHVWNETFTYDARDNRVAVTNAWGSVENTFDQANRQLATGNLQFSYDANGNQLSRIVGDRQIAYGYDGNNRQVSVERNHSIQIQEQFPHQINESYYFYDALGRRVQSDYWKNDERPIGQGNTGSWVQQGSEITHYNGLSFDHLAQLSYRGNIQYTNYPDGTRVTVHEHYTQVTLDHVYTHANGSLLLSSETQGNSQHINFQNRHYLHQDQLGSTVMTTNQWGREEQAIAYDAFGHVIDPPHRMISYTYNGKALDPMTGLYDYGFRDYDPVNGRFQTIDPIRDGRNWFVYVGNDPVNFIDLLGLEAHDGQLASDFDLVSDTGQRLPNELLAATTGVEILSPPALNSLSVPKVSLLPLLLPLAITSSETDPLELVSHYTSADSAAQIMLSGTIVPSRWETNVFVMLGQATPRQARNAGAKSTEVRIEFYAKRSELLPDAGTTQWNAYQFGIAGPVYLSGRQPNIVTPRPNFFERLFGLD